MSEVVIINGTRQPLQMNWRFSQETVVRPVEIGAGKQATLPREWPPHEITRFLDHHVRWFGMLGIKEADKINAHSGIFYYEKQARDEAVLEVIKERDAARDEEAQNLLLDTVIINDHQARHLGRSGEGASVGATQTSLHVTSDVDPEAPMPAKVINREIVPEPGRGRGGRR